MGVHCTLQIDSVNTKATVHMFLVSREITQNWIEKHHQKMLTTIQKKQAEKGTIHPNSEPCLYLLCCLVCLCAVQKRLLECGFHFKLNEFVEYVHDRAVTETRMSWETLKLIPKQSYFAAFVARLGCISPQNTFYSWLNWLSELGG